MSSFANVTANLYRLYAGWWDGNPAHLEPPTDAALANELADLAGGAGRLAERARAKAERSLMARGIYTSAARPR